MRNIFAIVLIFVLNLCSTQAVSHSQLKVAVASNFKTTFLQLKAIYEEDHSDKLIASFASTGMLYHQIKNGAPFDILLAADEDYIKNLEQEGYVNPADSFVYAIGSLVIYAPNMNLSKEGINILTSGKIKKIAIANPTTAPYGKAAKKILESYDIWEPLKSKFVFGENVGQAASFILTGNADVGIIAKSQLIDLKRQNQHPVSDDGILDISDEVDAAISQMATIISTSKSQEPARAFLTFLKSKAAKKIIKDSGYKLSSSE